ncbi:MAG TPA: hypothetical protein HA282_01155 [Nanoarchaeota archaeon]|nr:hypothetical protein [Candidatus Pacearchaeota archaeon]HIH17960.1 hypothetical protein [Nanoarchaeota archaeon]HIH33828.1 hypothetical protein [Nanoarchaeota archaeon]HIH50771.1 hypothetical protein [Nanoarchaeota archaeon]HIH65807.1 hypothetical protein [Nanoarchaeota archaeon]
MKKEQGIFTSNPEKAASRVAINGVMLGSIFVMLAVVFLEHDNFHPMAITQLVLSIPFLFVSSLAYAKIGYWKDTKHWDSFGYFTNTFGNFFVINAIGLISSGVSRVLAFSYFALIILLLLIYSYINISYTRSYVSKSFKFLLSLAIIFFGGILPLLR